MTALITTTEIADLLGAPLSEAQIAASDAYIELATIQLQSLLGYEIHVQADPEPATEKTYYGRSGSHSLIVDPFTELVSVSLNGTVLRPEDYSVGSSNRPFNYEVITQLSQGAGDEIKVTAKWGFNPLPASLKLLLANMFSVVSLGQTSGGTSRVKSETSLSHSVSYDTSASRYSVFASDNASLISLYRLPKPVRIDGGVVLRDYCDDL